MKFKIYIISLEDRWAKFIPNAFKTLIENGINLEDVSVFKGFRGDFINQDDYKLYPDWKIDVENSWWNREISDGEIGCAYSHAMLWRKMFFENHEYFIILEEDFVFKESFKTEFPKLLQYLNSPERLRFDMLYLGRNRAYDFEEEVLMQKSLNLVSPRFSYCTHAYILTQSGVIKLHNSKFLDNLIPLDEFMNCMFLENHIRPDLNKPIYKHQGQLKTLAFSNSIIGQSSNGNTQL